MESQQSTPNLLAYWLILLSVIVASHAVYANEDLQQKMNDPANWASWGGNYQGTRYSELDQINTENVHQLELAWQVSTDVLYRHGGGPLVVDDTIYLHTPYPNKVIAINQDDQSIKWEYEAKQNAEEIFGENSTLDSRTVSPKTFNHGLAYGEGMIFLHQADTTLVALDAKTGKKIWDVKNGEPYIGSTISSAPLIVKDKVILGNYSHEMALDKPGGYITAYHIKDGRLAWRGHSVGTDEKLLIDPIKTQTWTDGKLQSVGKNSSINSWRKASMKFAGAGTTGVITYDPDLNLIYYGSGISIFLEPIEHDMKWTSSLWARDADTGIVKWVYQLTPNNTWNYSAENESILVDQSINGTKRNTLVHFDSNGFVYTLDRETGELLQAEQYKENTNWASHIDRKTGRPVIVKKYKVNFDSAEIGAEVESLEGICPFAGGELYGSNIVSPTAYSPKRKLFYIASDKLCMRVNISKIPLASIISDTPSNSTAWYYFMQKVGNSLPDDYIFYGLPYEGRPQTSSSRNSDGAFEGHGSFEAWDPQQQIVKWRVDDVFRVDSGPVVTSGNIVFYGTKYGHFNALDAETGKLLYQFKAPGSIVGNINTWEYKKNQFIGFYVSDLGVISPETNVTKEKFFGKCGNFGLGGRGKEWGKQLSDVCAHKDKETNGIFMVFQLPTKLTANK